MQVYLGANQEALETIENIPGHAPHGDDVLCAVKHYIRDKRLGQIVQCVRAGAVNRLLAKLASVAPRKPIPMELQRKVCLAAAKIHRQKLHHKES